MVIKVMVGTMLGILLAVAVLVAASGSVMRWSAIDSYQRECARTGGQWIEKPTSDFHPYGGICR